MPTGVGKSFDDSPVALAYLQVAKILSVDSWLWEMWKCLSPVQNSQLRV